MKCDVTTFLFFLWYFFFCLKWMMNHLMNYLWKQIDLQSVIFKSELKKRKHFKSFFLLCILFKYKIHISDLQKLIGHLTVNWKLCVCVGVGVEWVGLGWNSNGNVLEKLDIIINLMSWSDEYQTSRRKVQFMCQVGASNADNGQRTNHSRWKALRTFLRTFIISAMFSHNFMSCHGKALSLSHSPSTKLSWRSSSFSKKSIQNLKATLRDDH